MMRFRRRVFFQDRPSKRKLSSQRSWSSPIFRDSKPCTINTWKIKGISYCMNPFTRNPLMVISDGLHSSQRFCPLKWPSELYGWDENEILMFLLSASSYFLIIIYRLFYIQFFLSFFQFSRYNISFREHISIHLSTTQLSFHIFFYELRVCEKY